MSSEAKESAQIKKLRRKLQQQMEAESIQINDNSIKKAKKAMQEWISRHQNYRINLRDKTISLFDENRHSAQVQNAFVQELFQKLHANKSIEQPAPPEASDSEF